MEQPASTLSAIHTSNSNVLERTAQKVSYAPDLLRQPDDDDTIKANSVKGSRAGSVYYSASESGTQSVPASVYQSGDLDDSDGEFELEVDGSSRTDAGLSQNATAASLENSSAPSTTQAHGGGTNPQNDEFDYAFDQGSREAASYKRTFKAQPAPAHLITQLHQGHLGSLAEESEEGSDAVSEPESGLIQDDEVEHSLMSDIARPYENTALHGHPYPHLAAQPRDGTLQEAHSSESSEPSEREPYSLLAAITEPYERTMREHAGESSVTSSTAHRNSKRHSKRHAEPGADGMVELNMDDDMETHSEGASFTENARARGMATQQFVAQQYLLVTESAREDDSASAAIANSAAADAVTAKQQEAPVTAKPASPEIAGPYHAASADGADKQITSSTAAAVAAAAEAAPVSASKESENKPSPATPASTVAISATPIMPPATAAASTAAAAVPDSLDFQDIELNEVQLSSSTAGKAAEGSAVAPASTQPAGVHDEWEEVNLARAREMAATVDAAPNPIPGDKVRYPEALGYFLAADIKPLKKGLKKSKPTHRLVSCFMRIQTSSKRLEKERTRLLCLAKMPFDENDMMHLRLLQTVYLNFVGGSGPVARYGAHWAAIGFQGLDPITDLRGCGVLGLLHLLLLHDHDPANAQALYRLSTTKETEFPLAPVSLNITKWTLQTLRDRKLSTAARKQQSMVTATSDFYTGTFYTFYNHWRDHKCTMADSGFVLKDIERRACGSPAAMVRQAAIRL